MSIVLVGSTSGSITLQEPAVAGTTTIDLPATSGTVLVAPTALTVPNTTGTVMVSGNMPAFSAYQSSAQNISNATFTKVQFQSEEYDTANAFDSTTNYRFQPQVAGYYQISGGIRLASTNAPLIIALYKNGSEYSRIFESGTASVSAAYNTILVSLNGSTDYLELYMYQGAGSTQALNTGISTRFQGVLVRAA